MMSQTLMNRGLRRLWCVALPVFWSAISALAALPVPQAVTAMAHDRSCDRITWQEVSGATEYRVYRKAAEGSYLLVGKVGAGTHAFFDAFCPDPGRTWSYPVATSDGTTESVRSTAADVVLPLAGHRHSLTLDLLLPGPAPTCENRYARKKGKQTTT